jgi:hypothetical protein
MAAERHAQLRFDRERAKARQASSVYWLISIAAQ